MNTNAFIFSNKLKPKLARHAVFWIIYYLQTVVISTHMTGFADFFNYHSYTSAIAYAATILPVCFFSVYVSLYILFPLLRDKKYFLFAAGLIVLAALNCIVELLVYEFARPFVCTDCGIITLEEKLNTVGAIGINVACFLGAVALGIKFTKKWYLQQAANRVLARQKITNELKLLKARIQPDFLFETLHALHNKIPDDEKKAAEILLKFSELLSYTLYECDENFVAAERVLQVIDEFVALEKMKMKTNIVSIATIAGKISNKYVPSFIVLPLIQHCVMVLHRQHCKNHLIEIQLTGTGDFFNCNIIIKTSVFNTLTKIYADLVNMFITRLETFYSNKYTLQFTEEKEIYSIALSLVLSDYVSAEKISNTTRQVYANALI